MNVCLILTWYASWYSCQCRLQSKRFCRSSIDVSIIDRKYELNRPQVAQEFWNGVPKIRIIWSCERILRARPRKLYTNAGGICTAFIFTRHTAVLFICSAQRHEWNDVPQHGTTQYNKKLRTLHVARHEVANHLLSGCSQHKNERPPRRRKIFWAKPYLQTSEQNRHKKAQGSASGNKTNISTRSALGTKRPFKSWEHMFFQFCHPGLGSSHSSVLWSRFGLENSASTHIWNACI